MQVNPRPPASSPDGAYDPWDMVRSKRAILDTGLAPIVFIVVNSFAGLEVAAMAAVAVAVCLMVERIVRRATPVNAVGGLVGTGIAVYIALRTGTVEGFFWPKVAQNAIYAVVFLISVAVRRPLIGYLAQGFYRWPSGYVRDPRVRPAFMVSSLAWVVLFGVRAVVYTVLILAGKAAWLGGVVLVLGWPAFAATAFFSYRYVTWYLKRTGAPDADAWVAEDERRAPVAARPEPQPQG